MIPPKPTVGSHVWRCHRKQSSSRFLSWTPLIILLQVSPVVFSLSAHHPRISSPIGYFSKSGIKTGLIRRRVLSSAYLENDLVAVDISTWEQDNTRSPEHSQMSPRLCVVRSDGIVSPLCVRGDDVPTDLYLDPRCAASIWTHEIEDKHVVSTFGEGWYGQRPVPSLGGGPGYGADADEVWSVCESTIDSLASSNTTLPVLDIGIAHGEKARGGAF